METIQTVQVDMRPFGKARPRVTSRGTFMPAAYRRNKEVLAVLFGPVSVTGPVYLGVVAEFRIPKSWNKARKESMAGKPHTSRPDVDNIVGAVMDSLFDDDSHVAEISCRKLWGDGDRLIITLRELQAR
jgi:Holliday junction resolvase RusA-like endonuclease